MDHRNKGNVKKTLGWLLIPALAILTLHSAVIGSAPFQFYSFLTNDTVPIRQTRDSGQLTAPLSDSLLPVADSLPARKNIPISGNDTTVVPTLDTFSFKMSKDTLDAPVTYHAEDSMIVDVPGKKIMLYGKKSDVTYADNELTAPKIEFDQRTNLVKAELIKDSTGQVIAYPTYIQTDFKSISDTIVFNMKTGKGLTKGTYTQQGEMFVYGEKIKKVDDQTFYALRGRFTTCNLDTPHFAFVSSKVKLINKKMAFTGPVHPEIEGVPLPVVLPFGIYPLSQGRHSGLIAPSWTANEQLGLALEGLGYYKVLNDNWDAVFRGTIYSYGGWTANLSPRYFKRYRYQGNLSIDVQRFKNGFKGDPDFSNTQTFNIRWSHSADAKARPGVTFSANVNAGSSKFNSLVPNSPVRNFTNQLNSSITYSKVWKDKPYNISISANHNQNTVQRLINVNLPDVSFNMNTLYPFRRKEAVGSLKWYENIGVALNTNARSLTSFYDTAGNIGKQIMDRLQWGASHSVPITLSLPPIGPLQISPTVSYRENWYQQKLRRQWNPNDKKVDSIINKGFYSARDMSFGLGITTRIFGMFGFNKKSAIQAIRHEIRPSIAISYKPNMNRGNHYNVQVDTTGRVARYSFYEGSVFGAFSEGRFGGINFGIDNNIQMKVRDRKGTADSGQVPVKKVALIDGFSISGNYNFLADSFRMSPLSMSARSTLFEKVNITANAVFDPYLTGPDGRVIDKLVWSRRPLSLGSMTSAGISLQSQFQGGEKKEGGAGADPFLSQQNMINNFPLDEFQQEAALISNNPGDFADFSIPWSVDFSYSLRLSRTRSLSRPGSFDSNINQDVSFNNSINLTPKWKIGMTGSYNITAKEIGVLSMYLSRDLHCWQMSINVAPVGRYRFFTINISPKSPMLRDIKVNRTRFFYDL